MRAEMDKPNGDKPNGDKPNGDKPNGHPFCISKPQNANTREQRMLLFTSKVLFILMCIKIDGIQVLAYPDAAGLYHFMFPKSRRRVPFDEKVLLKLRGEMRACRGVVIFELYCFRARFHDHNFYGTCGLPVRQKDISLAEMDESCLTMVATHTAHGADCLERCENIRSWFAQGHVPIREDGSFAWPDGADRPLVTVLDFKKVSNVDVEVRLREIKKELSKINSPPIEGLVAYMLYGPSDAERNAFPAWGKEGPYVALHYFAKIKAQDTVTTMCTAVHGSNATPGHPAQNYALLAHPLPDPKTDKPRTALSIPLDTEKLTELKMALKCQTKVRVLCAHIDWYWNTDRGPPLGVPSDMRFFLVLKVLFEPRNMHDLRAAGDVFAIQRPKARAIKAREEEPPMMSAVAEAAAAWAACEKAKAKAKAQEKRDEKKQERNEAHIDFNLKTDKWNTAKHQEIADNSRKQWKTFYGNVALAFGEAFTAEEHADAESYRPPKQLTAKEEADIESEQRYVRDRIAKYRSTHEYVDEPCRASMIARAADVGLVVGVDIIWPVVQLKSFVHDAWLCPSRDLAQTRALEAEQRAVTRLIRNAVFKCDYYSKDDRARMIWRASQCGLVVDSNMWPFLSQVNATKMQKIHYRIEPKDRKDLPELSEELAAKWKPRPAPRKLPLQQVDSLDKGKGRADPGPPKRGRPPAQARVCVLPAVDVDDGGDAAPKRSRPPAQARATPTVEEISSDHDVVGPVELSVMHPPLPCTQAKAAPVVSETARLMTERQEAVDKSHAKTVALLHSLGSVVVPFPGYDNV